MLRIYWNILEIRPAIGAAVPLFILDSEGQIFLSSSSSPEEEEKKTIGGERYLWWVYHGSSQRGFREGVILLY